MVQLYINNNLVDIDASTSISLDIKFEDLENPSAQEWMASKTVSLPATANNNKIFTNIWNFDHSSGELGGTFSFNPSKRVDFVLTKSNVVVEAGYLKMDRIRYNGQYPYYYDLTLYGNKGNLLYELTDKYLEDLNVNQSNYTHVINAQNVYNSYYNFNDYYRYILSYSGGYDNFDSDKIFSTISNSISNVLDMIVGKNNEIVVLTTNGYILIDPQDFDGTLYTRETLNTLPTSFNSSAGILYDSEEDLYLIYSGTTIYYNGNLTANEWSTYTTNYGTIVDGNITYNTSGSIANQFKYGFITTNNTYFTISSINTTGYQATSTIPFSINAGSKLDRKVVGTSLRGVIVSPNVSYGVLKFSTDSTGIVIGTQTTNSIFSSGLNITCVLIPKSETNPDYIFIGTKTNNSGSLLYSTNNSNNDTWAYSYQNISGMTNTLVEVTNTRAYCIYAYGQSGTISNYSSMYGISSNSPFTATRIETNITYNFEYVVSGDTYYAIFSYGGRIYRGFAYLGTPAEWEAKEGYYYSNDIENQNEHQRNEFRASYQRPALRLKNIMTQIFDDTGWSYSLDDAFFTNRNPYWENTWLIMRRLQFDADLPANHAGNVRTGDTITFQQMITKGISQYQMLLSFIKTFGLILTVDRINKRFTIDTKNTYFKDENIIDWTNKIDYSKQLEINPITFDYKYGIYKYQDGGSYYENNYYEKYSKEYGRTRINTGYEFSNSEKNYIDNIVLTNTIISTEYDRAFEGRNSSDDYLDDKILPALFTKSNDMIDYNDSSMHMVFIPNSYQTTNIPIRITDDNNDMLNESIFMWTQTGGITTSSIPIVNTVMQSGSYTYSLDFSRPEQTYYDISSYPDGITLYDRFNYKYIQEIYNIRNKILTVYFNLNFNDIANFNFSNFVRINNNIYHVVKINNYNINDKQSTKVELIKVYDINNYSSGQNIRT